jgi:hypothetical protein
MPRQQQEKGLQTVEQEEMTAEFQALGLNSVEIQALKRQGSIVREVRGSGVIYKLRFRIRGRHRAKYLGLDAHRAAEIERHLRQLQYARGIRQRLRELSCESAAALRAMKQRLEPVLKQVGLEFHGLSIRRSRHRDESTKETE